MFSVIYKKTYFPACFLAVFWIFSLPCQAADDVKITDLNKITQLINIFGSTVKYPIPSWYKVGKSPSQSEYYRNQQSNQFVFEQIPKGDKFENWTRLYAVHGMTFPKEKDFPLKSYVYSSVIPFVQICGKENIEMQNIFETSISKTYLLVCQNSPLAPKGSGYGKGIGEVGLFRIFKSQNTFVKVYQEWRGKNFKINDKSTWPVSDEELVTMIKRFGNIHVSKGS